MLDGLTRGAPAFLASVTNAAEAETAVAGGADIIDAKDPSQGALGALSPERIRAIVSEVKESVPVSATIGDLPSDAAVMCTAARSVAGCGVTLVKCGFFGTGPHHDAVAALGQLNLGQARLAGVLMADMAPDFALIAAMARAGFAAVMLDTGDKTSGGLRAALSEARIVEFLTLARRQGLVAGLAGSLAIRDIAPLIPLNPDVLGFRGALCGGGRTGSIDAARLVAVKSALGAAVKASALAAMHSGGERSVA